MLEDVIDDQKERARHQAAIHYLARELGFPEPEVGRVYERELVRLNSQARVKDFLTVLVGRRVKEDLRQHEHTSA
jgi:hypothetical protein